jgi:signal transduction histidine kinase
MRGVAVSDPTPDVLAAFSHELRTPLNGMIGFSELLQRGDVGPLSDEQQEVVDDILQSARHLLETVDGMLDFARLESGRLDLHPEPVDIVTWLPRLAEELRGLVRQHGATLAVEVAPDLPRMIADTTSLRRVVYQSVFDAIKRTGHGARIVARAAVTADGSLCLEVADNGPPARPQDRRGPLGLGVAFATRLAEAQGGRAGLRSEPGPGNVFFAVLPSRPENHR